MKVERKFKDLAAVADYCEFTAAQLRVYADAAKPQRARSLRDQAVAWEAAADLVRCTTLTGEPAPV